MPDSKDISTYPPVYEQLTRAVYENNEPAQIEFASVSQAVSFRRRFYSWRKLLMSEPDMLDVAAMAMSLVLQFKTGTDVPIILVSNGGEEVQAIENALAKLEKQS